MMRLRNFSMIISVLLISGCTTSHFGEIAEPMPGLRTSCHKDGYFNTRNYQVFRCTFENLGNEVVTLKVKPTKFSENYWAQDPPSLAPVIVEPIEEQAVVTGYIEQLHDNAAAMQVWAPVVTGLVAGAALHAAGSHGSGGRSASSAIVGGAIVGGLSSITDDARIEAAHQNGIATVNLMRDDNRIESRPFMVPPGLHVRRHLMARVEADSPKPCSIELCFEDPVAKCIIQKLEPGQTTKPIYCRN